MDVPSMTVSLLGLVASYIVYRKVNAPTLPLDLIPSIPLWDAIRLILRTMPFNDYMTKMKYYVDLPLQKLFLGRTIVLAASPSHAKIIFSRMDLFQKPTRPPAFRHTLDGLFFGMNILDANGDVWKKYKKAVQPAFNKIWPAQVFQRLANDLVAEWTTALENGSGEIEVTDWMQRLTLEVLGQGLFDVEFNGIKDDKSRPLELYRYLMKGFADFKYLFMPRMDRPWNPFRRSYFKAMDEMNAIFLDMIETKKAQVKERLDKEAMGEVVEQSKKDKDLLTLMLESFYDEADAALSDEEIRANMALFFLAGHDTTSTALVSEIYAMAVHPDIQHKAREEVLSVLGNDQPITQRTKLPYLESIMNECLRLYPPVTMLPFRQPAQQDVTLQGTDGPNVIPPHAYISLQIMAIHRNPTMWHNPLEFNVDRWSKDEGVDKRAGFYPFGGGIRTCIGMNFSLLEQRVVLSTLLKHFKWHLPVNSPHTHDMQCTGSLLLKPLPMTVVFTKL